MTDNAKFWNKIARKYAKTPIRQQEAYEAKLAHTQTFFTAETRLFEYGCGTGTTALHHASKVTDIMATDISVEMLTIACEKRDAAGITNVRFVKWNIETDAITAKDFDVVMAHSILHLVEDMPAVLKKTHKILKPGGVFISSTISMGNWNPMLRLFLTPLLVVMKLFDKAPKTVNFLKKETLYAAVTEAGFDILELPKRDWGAAVFIAARKI